MGSKSSTSVALFFFLNVIFFTTVTAWNKHPPPPTTTNCPPPPKPTPTPTPSSGTCPRDALKLGVCADVLNLVNVVIGSPPTKPCCALIQGLANLEAAVCLCTALKANILGINLNIPISLSLIIDACAKKVPKGFQCA
ncbi:hypothetical protein ACHQM5_001292 [Ranunculus cassubicifolius]